MLVIDDSCWIGNCTALVVVVMLFCCFGLDLVCFGCFGLFWVLEGFVSLLIVLFD